MRIFLNPACGHGSGYRRFQNIRAELLKKYGSYQVEIIRPTDIGMQLVQALDEGEHLVVAAGGDGTVNLLVEALIKERPVRRNILLGAIGIGSSNDFHKPFKTYRMIRGVPIRLNGRHTVFRDVIDIRYRVDDQWHQRYACINASLGICAEANALFNDHHRLIHALKKISTDLAIFGAAVIAIFLHQNNTCRIKIEDDQFRTISLTNLGILKSPHFAGCMKYDTPVEVADGVLRINLCEGMNRFEVLRLLNGLMHTQFRNFNKTASWTGTRVEITAPHSTAVEMDGEVVYASDVVFTVIPHALRVCT